LVRIVVVVAVAIRRFVMAKHILAVKTSIYHVLLLLLVHYLLNSSKCNETTRMRWLARDLCSPM
jgi:hypothetical protein